jgi:hypothetical protein
MRVIGLVGSLGSIAHTAGRSVRAWRVSRRVGTLPVEGEAQLALGSCASALMIARANLRAIARNSPLVAVLDDRIRHLEHTSLHPRASAERATPFPCL